MKCALFVSIALVASTFAQIQEPDLTTTPSCPVCCLGRGKCSKNDQGLYVAGACCPQFCCSYDSSQQAGSFVCCTRPPTSDGCRTVDIGGDLYNQCAAGDQVSNWECTTELTCQSCQAKPHCTFQSGSCTFMTGKPGETQIQCQGGQATNCATNFQRCSTCTQGNCAWNTLTNTCEDKAACPNCATTCPNTPPVTASPTLPPPPVTASPTPPPATQPAKYTGTCYNRCNGMGWGVLREKCLMVRGDDVKEQCPEFPGRGIHYCNCPAKGEYENKLKNLCCGGWAPGWVNNGWIIRDNEATQCSCDAHCSSRKDVHGNMVNDCCTDVMAHCNA